MANHTNQNVLSCTECSFVSHEKVDLCNHYITHNLYACKECDYRGNSMQGLNSHETSHKHKRGLSISPQSDNPIKRTRKHKPKNKNQ